MSILKMTFSTATFLAKNKRESITSYFDFGPSTTKVVFGFGITNSSYSVKNTINLFDNTASPISETNGVGTARGYLGAAGYGGDKVIFGYGYTSSAHFSITNLLSNTGVISADITGVGTQRCSVSGLTYGADKCMFIAGSIYADTYGSTTTSTTYVNLVNNTGVVVSDTSIYIGYGQNGTATNYGGGRNKGMFGFGGGRTAGTKTSNNYLIDETGVFSSAITTVALKRSILGAASYGNDKAIFGFGYPDGSNGTNLTNLVSNTGVVAADVTTVATNRGSVSAATYGGDKAMFGGGRNYSPGYIYAVNLVNNTGDVGADITYLSLGITGRYGYAAAGFSTT